MSDKRRRYAPLWISLFSSAAALARVVGGRYLVGREWKFEWKDVATAVAGAAIGYAIFRGRHGNKTSGRLTR